MTDEYTPTTADVREKWASDRFSRASSDVDKARRHGSFDRWLAGVIADAKRQAWERGFDAGVDDALNHEDATEGWDSPCIPNPYEQEEATK